MAHKAKVCAGCRRIWGSRVQAAELRGRFQSLSVAKPRTPLTSQQGAVRNRRGVSHQQVQTPSFIVGEQTLAY